MTLTDQSTQVRPGEELDAAVIAPYLKANIPGLDGLPSISQFPGGASNLTYLVSYPGRDFVLRRPPFGQKAKSAHDMGREFRILNQLNNGFPYCPKAYVHCTDSSLIGGEFYVMERVKGIILRSDIPAELNLDASRTEALCKSFIDRLVELHQVDYNACGLADLGKPEGYVQRQVEGWTSRYEKALTPDAPRWEQVIAWLHDKMPADHPKPGIVHNDYRFDNVILDADNPMRIIGVLDWEMATLGDPLMDLGNSLANHLRLVFDLPDAVIEIYRSMGIDLDRTNGASDWTLPMPATYVVDTTGRIVDAFVNADYRVRREPADVLDVLRSLRI